MKKLIVPLLVILLCSNCSSTKSPSNNSETCFSFDIRQCQTDLFANRLPTNSNEKEFHQAMQSWFEEQGLNVIDIKIVFNYHEFVCEACDVCPTGDRFYVKIDQDSTSALNTFNLLNLETGLLCSEIFD